MGTRRDFMILKPASLCEGSQANSAMTLGLIGCGNRGMYVSGIFAKNEFARVAAICDIYEDRIEAGTEDVLGRSGLQGLQGAAELQRRRRADRHAGLPASRALRSAP